MNGLGVGGGQGGRVMCGSLLTPGGRAGKFSGGLTPPPRLGKETGFGLFPVIVGNGEAPGSFMGKREDLTASIFSVNKR